MVPSKLATTQRLSRSDERHVKDGIDAKLSEPGVQISSHLAITPILQKTDGQLSWTARTSPPKMSLLAFTIRWDGIGMSDTLLLPSAWLSDGQRPPELVGLQRQKRPGIWLFLFIGKTYKRAAGGPVQPVERIMLTKYREDWLVKWLPRFRALAARQGVPFYHIEGLM